MSIVLGDALSLLLFRLHSGRLLGINLLKVQEIIPCPTLTKLPSRHPPCTRGGYFARFCVDGDRLGQGHWRAGRPR
jgi:chemotaxis signal transduction protein